MAFIDDNALSHGAAIAFYAVTGFLPALVTGVAVMDALFGKGAIEGVVSLGLHVLMGREGNVVVGIATKGVAGQASGIGADLIGATVLIVAASGAFNEIQWALNAIWKATPPGNTMSRFLRARIVSLALVLGLGVLLVASLFATALLSAWQPHLGVELGVGHAIAALANFLLSLTLIWAVFAAIYKFLPDLELQWSDVVVGALVTALLYELGEFLVGVYLHNRSTSPAINVAGGLIVLLLWIYYSAQAFLFGAEFTKIYAQRHGSRRGKHDSGSLAMHPGRST